MKTATLHVKISPEISQKLKSMARKRKSTVGHLVRMALDKCYQLEMPDLNEKQQQAVSAYKGGYISLGKLSEEMGMSAWETRDWLSRHDITQVTSFGENDAENA